MAEENSNRTTEKKIGNDRCLRVENLVKHFWRRTVLSDVTFKLPTNKVTALVGTNGAGKSTLIKVLIGLEKPSAGTIFIDAENITILAIQKRIRKGLGYMAQGSSAVTELTVEDNLYLVPNHSDADDMFFENLLVEFNLNHIRKQKAKTLSGGELQKLEFCLCMAARPRLVFLDEPFSGLEPKAVKSICETVKIQRAKGIGFLIADHRIEDLRSIAESYIFLNEGCAVFFDNAVDFFQNAVVQKDFLGC